MKNERLTLKEREKVSHQKNLEDLFYTYLDSELASDTKDRQQKLYTYLELKKLL